MCCWNEKQIIPTYILWINQWITLKFFVYLLIEVKQILYVFDSIYLCQHIFFVDPEVNPLYSLVHNGSGERERERERERVRALWQGVVLLRHYHSGPVEKGYFYMACVRDSCNGSTEICLKTVVHNEFVWFCLAFMLKRKCLVCALVIGLWNN